MHGNDEENWADALAHRFDHRPAIDAHAVSPLSRQQHAPGAVHVAQFSFGHLFRFTTWGESHGPALGVVVDGCPPMLDVDLADIQRQMDRRKPGQSRFTPRSGARRTR